eukprot:3524625-Prymnesium_polylepis.1
MRRRPSHPHARRSGRPESEQSWGEELCVRAVAALGGIAIGRRLHCLLAVCLRFCVVTRIRRLPLPPSVDR